jgi:hypothetical protein
MSENEPTRTSSLQLARPQRRGSIGSPQSTRGHAGSQEGFEVAFVDRVEGELRKPLADVAMVAFELVQPVRTFPSYKGQRNYPGFYWAACSGLHVGFESWLERDEAMALDFDAHVVGFAAQPFWLFWPDTSRIRSHAPDFFARTATGGGVVIDCRGRRPGSSRETLRRLRPQRGPARRLAGITGWSVSTRQCGWPDIDIRVTSSPG